MRDGLRPTFTNLDTLKTGYIVTRFLRRWVNYGLVYLHRTMTEHAYTIKALDFSLLFIAKYDFIS